LRILVCAALIVAVGWAQEEGGGGGGGGRGGRGGGRGARGAAGTRDFLGLGANGPAPDEAAAKKGEPLYKQNCGACHGERARGAQAPNLVRSVVVLHDEKGEEIGPVIKNGRPQAGMPGFPNLSAEDIHNIGQYLKMQVELAANRGTYGATYASVRNQTTGDPKKGEAYFNTACKSCHSTTGDLAKIGSKFPQASTLQSRWIWPTPPGPQKATVTTPSGEKVAGTVRVLNDFDVSLTDASGNYRYWRRAAVKVEVEDKLGGHRALLPKLSDDDIHNMTAYLVTVK
jgi:cytochrome c oxidase cbb3-type subunit III